MRQLALFPGAVPEPEPEPTPEPEPAPDEPDEPAGPAPSDVLPGQIHLFGDRTVRFGRARAAIAEGRLDDARRDLLALKKRFPDDALLAREAARTTKLARAFAAALAASPDARPAALLGFARGIGAAEDEPWASLRRTAMRRVAEALASCGETATLEGEPAGFYLIEAGAFDEAAASLARAASGAPSAHVLLLLGDATLLAGGRPEARRRYLEALVLDPFDAALAAVRDEEVRALPDVARDELEIEDEPRAWSAPVGVVTGVLPSPASLPRAALAPAQPGGRTAGEQQALAAARAFVQALADAASPEGRGAGAIEVRRTMKRLSPPLFAAYMERVVRGKRGS